MHDFPSSDLGWETSLDGERAHKAHSLTHSYSSDPMPIAIKYLVIRMCLVRRMRHRVSGIPRSTPTWPERDVEEDEETHPGLMRMLMRHRTTRST